MLLIEDIKIREVCGNRLSVSRCKSDNTVPMNYMDAKYLDSPIEYDVEHVNGERFINARGETVCIGMTKHVQDAVGLPFEAFSNMNKELDSLRASFASHVRQIKDLSATLAVSTTKLDAASSASLWKRIRYVFTKRLP